MAYRTFFIKDKNLKPENIKQGVKILNVTGTYEGGGSGDCEQWPSLISVHNEQSPTHAGVIFDTGFPIADGYINEYFNGYFSSSYSDNESFFLFGNRSNVDPETGHYYYWGVWNNQDKLIVSFGGGSGDSAVFTLGPSMNDYDVPVWDLPISWVRTENMDYGSPDDEYGTEYIYEVKVGNIIKYAPAFDDRLELFDGLNMCVFGRNSSEYPGEYGASSPSNTRCSRIAVTSADGEHNAYEMSLEPYVKNGTATLMKHYTDYTAGEETVEPLEPIMHEGAETNFDNFFIYHDPYQAGIEVAPSTKEQHIDTVSNTDVFPYVTVLPMNLASASETITENGQVVISAGDYGADGISEITLDISVGGGGGSDWLTDALAGNITDLSGYTLPAPTHNYQYYNLFSNKGLSITKSPQITGAMSNAQSGCYGMFKSTPITHLYCGGLTNVNGQTSFTEVCSDCTNLEFIDFSSLTQVSSRYVFQSAFYNCPNLKTAIIHPEALKFEANINNVVTQSATVLENLTLSAVAVNSIQLDWQPNLTAASVLNVLTHLDLTVSGKSVNFYSSGLTVTDDAQGSIQTAYDAAVAAGWTINNLTIAQP